MKIKATTRTRETVTILQFIYYPEQVANGDIIGNVIAVCMHDNNTIQPELIENLTICDSDHA